MTNRFSRFTALALVMATIGAPHAFAQATDAPAAAAGKSLKQTLQSGTTYATVNGEKVTGADIMKFVEKMPPQLQSAPADKLLEPIVNQMINDRLVAKAAMAQHLEDDAKVKQAVNDAREQIVRDRFVEKALEGKVTDAAVRAKYDEVVKNTPDQEEIRASHILVADQKTADEVLAKLAKGEDFAKLAKQYSKDPTKDNGGDLGYFVRPAMVKEFGDAAFAMKKGEVSKTAIKSQFGYHIIKVVDRRAQVKPKFDDVKDRIREQLTSEQIRDMVKKMRDDAKVEITLPKA